MTDKHSEPIKVNIISEGVGTTTHVLMDDGTEVDGVRAVHISINGVNEMVVATLTILMPVLQITAQLGEVVFECPFCNDSIVHSGCAGHK